jgi:DNA sulfur modification protein DndD
MQILGTISAAQRAMLALSITWALHSQAGINFPFLIDTPVANLSSTSRKEFAKTLKDISQNKQILLLFTDTEYSNEIQEIFDSHLNMCKKITCVNGNTEIR